jgi:predicted DCC family thiol-disulfide oxidoreductase YuxK
MAVTQVEHPHPAQTPARGDQPTIVFDGQCRFCRMQMERIRRRDRHGVFAFMPRHHPDLIGRFPQLAGENLGTGLRLVETSGQVHVGADAVYHIARRLPVWRLAAWLYRVPVLRQLLRWAYHLIARNRLRLAGTCDDGACAL